MSDTPRTDKFTHSISKLANHARQLERDLADMTADRDSETRLARQYKAERDEAVERYKQGERGSFSSSVRGMRLELDAATAESAKMRELAEFYEDALKNIAVMPEHDQDDAHRLRAKAVNAIKARAALARSQAVVGPNASDQRPGQ